MGVERNPIVQSANKRHLTHRLRSTSEPIRRRPRLPGVQYRIHVVHSAEALGDAKPLSLPEEVSRHLKVPRLSSFPTPCTRLVAIDILSTRAKYVLRGLAGKSIANLLAVKFDEPLKAVQEEP